MNFLGAPYPITKHPRGFFRTQEGVDQIKSDLLVLLLTEPGERVMLPEFGTGLKKFLFEPNDSSVNDQVKEEIARSISLWEPRIAVQDIYVGSGRDNRSSLNEEENNVDHVLFIRIRFTNFNNIQKVEELKLELPGG
jgi:phage baseplate assembly protein W